MDQHSLADERKGNEDQHSSVQADPELDEAFKDHRAIRVFGWQLLASATGYLMLRSLTSKTRVEFDGIPDCDFEP